MRTHGVQAPRLIEAFTPTLQISERRFCSWMRRPAEPAPDSSKPFTVTFCVATPSVGPMAKRVASDPKLLDQLKKEVPEIIPMELVRVSASYFEARETVAERLPGADGRALAQTPKPGRREPQDLQQVVDPGLLEPVAVGHVRQREDRAGGG